MSLNDDSRPFSVLRENAKDFLSHFDNDVKMLNSTFSSKMSALLCDPDSLNPGSTKKLNAHMEFSKAKLEIFVSMKSLVGQISSQWEEQIGEMMSTFLENIEIFLAGTKLAVTLPTSAEISEIEKKRSPEALKGRKGRSSLSSPVGSLYPSLMNTAKSIPDSRSSPSNSKSPKHVTILTPQEMSALNSLSSIMEVSDSDEEEMPATQTPVKRGRASKSMSPSSLKKLPAKPSLRKTAIINSLVEKTDTNTNEMGKPSLRRRHVAVEEEISASEESSASTPTRRKTPKRNKIDAKTNNISLDKTDDDSEFEEVGRRSASLASAVDSTPGQKGRRRRIPEGTLLDLNIDEVVIENQNEVISTPVGRRTPKNVHFSVGMDINEDLDIYSPQVTLPQSTPRRKTVNQVIDNSFVDSNATPTSTTRGRGKRKTIAASTINDTVAPSPKRLKRGSGRSSVVVPLPDEDSTNNLLESDDTVEIADYSPWMPLNDVSTKVPAQPGIYELKVAAAKKPAYIGACDSLRQKLTLHKLKHSSGHKHLDKFIERNVANIFVRYEQLSSVGEAKELEKTRVRSFVDQYKTTPAYN